MSDSVKITGAPRHEKNWSRRLFLRTALTGVAVGGLGLGELAVCEIPSPAQQLPTWLINSVGDPQAAARLGRSYLSHHPNEQQRADLLAAITRAVDTPLDFYEPSKPVSAQIVAALQRIVPNEYRQGAVVTVENWVLSQTEARLYALVTTGSLL